MLFHMINSNIKRDHLSEKPIKVSAEYKRIKGNQHISCLQLVLITFHHVLFVVLINLIA